MFTGQMPINPWDIPAVKMSQWLEVILHHKGIVDAINTNFVKEFRNLAKNTRSSVCEVKQLYTVLVTPVSKNFTTLQSFLDYLGNTVEEETICHKSLAQDEEGAAWKQTDNLITQACSEGAILSDKVRRSSIHVR